MTDVAKIVINIVLYESQYVECYGFGNIISPGRGNRS